MKGEGAFTGGGVCFARGVGQGVEKIKGEKKEQRKSMGDARSSLHTSYLCGKLKKKRNRELSERALAFFFFLHDLEKR